MKNKDVTVFIDEFLITLNLEEEMLMDVIIV